MSLDLSFVPTKGPVHQASDEFHFELEFESPTSQCPVINETSQLRPLYSYSVILYTLSPEIAEKLPSRSILVLPIEVEMDTRLRVAALTAGFYDYIV